MHNADIFGSATKAATNELVINSGTSAAVEFRSGDTEIKGDIIVAGNDIKSGSLSSATTAITLSSADVTVAGDLTVTGDDITMGTNTAGYVMVADGTNFNPVAISGVLDVASNGAVTLDNTFISSHSELAGGSIAAIDEILVNDGGSGHKRYGVDNFIKDKNYLKILRDEKTWEGFPKFNWWDGWWVCKPRNTLEKVIENIWKKFGNFENTVAVSYTHLTLPTSDLV